MHSISGLTFTLPRITLSSMIRYSFFLLLAVGLLLPARAGGSSMRDPRLLVISLTAPLYALYIFRKRSFVFLQVSALFLILCLSVFIFYTTWNALNDPASYLKEQISESMQFLITFSIPLLAFFLYKEKLVSVIDFFRWVIQLNIFYMSVKCVILILYYTGCYDGIKLLSSMGWASMRCGIWGGLERWQTSLDVMAPFLIFFVLQNKFLGLDLKERTVKIYVLLAIITTFFGFSRMLTAIFGSAVMLHVLTLSGIRFVKACSLIAILLASIVLLIGPDLFVQVLFRDRQSNMDSDSHRVLQVQEMFRVYEETPLVGKGMGASAPNPIFKQSFRFEVQWVAFLMQFGLVGISFLLMPLLFILWQLLRPPMGRSKFACACLFCAWMLAGFTNPFLISLQSGIIYTLFLFFPMAIAQERSRRDDTPHRKRDKLPPSPALPKY